MKKILFNDNWRVKRIGDSHEYNLSWRSVTIPHDAVIGLPRDKNQADGTKKAFFVNGSWEYVKVFSAPDEWQDKTVFVEFEGVQNHAKVYLNGSYIGGEPYGYSEFTVCLDKYLKYGGDNVLKVICKTENDSRWYTGAGIYRNVNLLVANKIHILNNGIKITTLTADKNTAEIQVECELSQSAENIHIQLTHGGKVAGVRTQKAAINNKRKFTISNPQLWSAEHPYLYKCEIIVLNGGDVVDSAEQTFGIRKIEVNAQNGLTVNNERVNLRGACIHHDNGVIGVRTYKDAEYRRVKKLKEAGFNAIRSAHHPASRYILQACDELGMYVMDESFDCWHNPKSSGDYSNDFSADWKYTVRAMVEKDYNCPSVIMYSVGNEISDLATAAGVELAKEISGYMKSLDSTRYTTVAINGLLLLMEKMELAKQLSGETEEPQKDINEAMSSLDEVMININNAPSMDAVIKGGCDAVDIAGYNYMHNRYAPDAEKYPDRVIVGSETYAKYIAEMWKYITNHNNVIGDFTWTGWDYLGETGIGVVSYEKRDYHQGFYAGYPCITAYCGDIDITGFRMPQSYYREIVYGLRKAPYIAVHNPEKHGQTEYLSTWGWGDCTSSWSFEGFENAPLTVDVYATGEVELFLNGKSLGKVNCGKNYMATFTVPYEKGTLKAVSGGYEYTLTSAESDVKIRLEAEQKTILKGGLAFVNIAITDNNGVVHYGKDKKITLNVDGGKLLGFGSGSPFTEESYADNVHTTYNGRVLAVILAENQGEIKVTASSNALESATAIINVK